MHVLIDSNIYRSDRKRHKPAFRAILRLAKAGKLHLHLPFFVKAEVLSQIQDDVRSAINRIKSAAHEILALTAEPNLEGQAGSILTVVAAMKQNADSRIATDLQGWIIEAQAIEHPIAATHGSRVADAYFAGSAPFGNKKQRTDIPDSFIWETALDVVKTNGELIVVSNDARIYKAADQHPMMEAYNLLEDLLKSPACQHAIEDLDASESNAKKIARIKALLPDEQINLQRRLADGVASELAWRTVRHRSIPDDNGEGLVSNVNEPENVTFAFTEVEHLGDGDLAVPFTANVDCELNFSIYRGDYDYGADTDISVSDWSDHYLDAHKTYTLSIEGSLTVSIDTDALTEDEATDDDLREIIQNSDVSVDITGMKVQSSEDSD